MKENNKKDFEREKEEGLPGKQLLKMLGMK